MKEKFEWNNGIYTLIAENDNILIYEKNSYILTTDFAENKSVLIVKYNSENDTYTVLHQLSIFDDDIDVIKLK